MRIRVSGSGYEVQGGREEVRGWKWEVRGRREIRGGRWELRGRIRLCSLHPGLSLRVGSNVNICLTKYIFF